MSQLGFIKKPVAFVFRMIQNKTHLRDELQYALSKISEKVSEVKGKIDQLVYGGKENDISYRELYNLQQDLSSKHVAKEDELKLTTAQLESYEKLLDKNLG